jgi:hypothetical protein
LTTKNSITCPSNSSHAGKTEFFEDFADRESKKSFDFNNLSIDENLENTMLMIKKRLEPISDKSLTSIIEKLILESDSILSSGDVANRILELQEPISQPLQYDVVKYYLNKEALKTNSTILKIRDDAYLNRRKAKEILRVSIKKRLHTQGFLISDMKISSPKEYNKEEIRKLHLAARYEKYQSLKKLLTEKESSFIIHFADGKDIDLDNLKPRIEEVHTGTWQNDLFRYATLLWSVPVSSGFGRRSRFLVWDDSNRKLIGLFALGDPVFNLSCRDNWIGWNSIDREKRLYNVMDIFVLGSVPPYNQLLGGKLVSLLAASNEVRTIIKHKYMGKKTIIEGATKNPELALLTTGSALGKSSIYDRIVYEKQLLYQRMGTSEGWGHFHFTNDIFEDIRFYLSLKHPGMDSRYKFGQGPNWKLRTVRKGLEELGLSGDLLKHGINREMYGIPLAYNFREFLLGHEKKLKRMDLPIKDLYEFFKSRWLYGRAERKPEYREFTKETIISLILKNVSNLKED